MKTSKRYSVPHRRVREGKTNYKSRLNLLKGRTPRLVIRKSLLHITVQAVEYSPKGDKVTMTTRSGELKKLGWKHATGNTPSAYLTGYLAGKKLSKLNTKKLILDLGLQSPVKGSRLFAALKGVVDSGIEVPHDESVLPDEGRLMGKHIKDASLETDTKNLKQKING